MDSNFFSDELLDGFLEVVRRANRSALDKMKQDSDFSTVNAAGMLGVLRNHQANVELLKVFPSLAYSCKNRHGKGGYEYVEIRKDGKVIRVSHLQYGNCHANEATFRDGNSGWLFDGMGAEEYDREHTFNVNFWTDIHEVIIRVWMECIESGWEMELTDRLAKDGGKPHAFDVDGAYDGASQKKVTFSPLEERKKLAGSDATPN